MKCFGMVFAILLILFAVTATILGIAGNGELLAAEMLRVAPPASTGLPEREYPAVGNMIAGYLTGREESFQHQFTDDTGVQRLCFQPHEAAHMADCRGLIRLDRLVMLLSAGIALIVLGAAILLRRDRNGFYRGMLWGLRAVGVLAAALLIWALADFDGFFVAFHRVAFTNEGWLLNPGTDLLIRLMPEEFFVALGIRGLLWVLIAPIGIAIAAHRGLRS